MVPKLVCIYLSDLFLETNCVVWENKHDQGRTKSSSLISQRSVKTPFTRFDSSVSMCAHVVLFTNKLCVLFTSRGLADGPNKDTSSAHWCHRPRDWLLTNVRANQRWSFVTIIGETTSGWFWLGARKMRLTFQVACQKCVDLQRVRTCWNFYSSFLARNFRG